MLPWSPLAVSPLAVSPLPVSRLAVSLLMAVNQCQARHPRIHKCHGMWGLVKLEVFL